jgi:hypothetical protein
MSQKRKLLSEDLKHAHVETFVVYVYINTQISFCMPAHNLAFIGSSEGRRM